MKITMSDHDKQRAGCNPQSVAAWKYSPAELCKCLIKDGDTFIVDKSIAIHDPGDASLFIIALNSIYGWSYEGDFKSVTIYLEADPTGLFGGAYNLSTRSKVTRRRVASTFDAEQGRLDSNESSGFTPYIYTDETMAEILEKIA